MDLSITYPTFFRNLKFWGFHTLINSIPSLVIAYLHDWNTLESFIAMGVGITLFALMLAFFTSMKDMNRICTTGFMAQAIKAGTRFRLILFILSLPAVLSLVFFFLGGHESLDNYTSYTGFIWAPDFVTGIISHGFYQSLRGVIPISGIHEFIPTICMTILQGCLLMGMLIAAGIIFAAIGAGYKSSWNKPLKQLN
jgi:hypothetical protein|tara:strand:- start:248 stop:835 length:588 start_codon:yes stop_codon:yes gene_type:complete